MSEAELPRYFVDERNVGIVLGGIAGIVDVDLDNPVAVAVANFLLSDTVKSGRKKNPRSHSWFICDPVPTSRLLFVKQRCATALANPPGGP